MAAGDDGRHGSPAVSLRRSFGAYAVTAPATPEELFASAYDEAGRRAARLVADWQTGNCGTRWSEDLHSAAMEMLWLCAVRFDGGRGVPFSHYWRTRLRGAMVDELRRLSPGSRSEHTPSYRPLSPTDDQPDADLNPEDIVVGRAELEELATAVAALPRHLRTVINGRRDGLTQSAIAVTEGVSGAAISERKSSARRILAARLGDRAA